MNSFPNPQQTNPHYVAVAALKEAYEQFGRADEQLTRVDEQVSKLEQDAAPHPSDPQNLIDPLNPAENGDRPYFGGPAMRGFIGFLLAVSIGVAAVVWQSPFYGDAARQIVARWAPQLVTTLSPTLESLGLPAQPSPPTIQPTSANTAPPQPAPLAQTASEDVAPTAVPLSPEPAQLLQSMARDLATVGQEIEQLKISQAQMTRANAELAEQLKATQVQMARDKAELSEQVKAAQAQMARPIAKASEHNLRPKTLAPPRPIATPTRGGRQGAMLTPKLLRS